MLSNKQQNQIINLLGAALGQAARSEDEQLAYPTDSSLPSSQSLAQSHENDMSIQETAPLSQVNQPLGHNFK
jgi:hypothetical protein